VKRLEVSIPLGDVLWVLNMPSEIEVEFGLHCTDSGAGLGYRDAGFDVPPDRVAGLVKAVAAWVERRYGVRVSENNGDAQVSICDDEDATE
jgi:hypothetical protein